MDRSGQDGEQPSGWRERLARLWRPHAPAAYPSESQVLAQRRDALGVPAPDRMEALALSGGGIRSATFSLGVLQALAEASRDPATPGGRPVRGFLESMLSRFDYLSTVSGGGFIGSFMVGLFVPGRLRSEADSAAKAADDAQAVLASGPPERIRSSALDEPGFVLKAPLAWLRENGRYLAPSGTGDLVYAAGLGLRNWISLHVVIGVTLLALLVSLALVRSELLALAVAGRWRQWEFHQLTSAQEALQAHAWAGAIWWSSLFWLALLPLAVALVAGVAYWMIRRGPEGRSEPLNLSVAGMAVSAAVLAGLAGLGWCGDLSWLWLMLAGLVGLAVVLYIVVATRWPLAGEQGVRLTRLLASALTGLAAVLGLALIETLGQTAYLLTLNRNAWLPTAGAAVGALLSWLVRWLGGSGRPVRGLDKLPLNVLGGIAGGLILLLGGALWAMFAQALVWSGGMPSYERWCCLLEHWQLWCLAGGLLVMAIFIGQFPAFINLSSLQGFYSARLIRSYLGASNGERYKPDNRRALSSAEPLAGDNLPLRRFWTPEQGLSTWAPVHIVNLTVNKTVDPAEQLVQRDRKGQPMAVLPFGFSIDRWSAAFPRDAESRLLHAPMNLGEWVGASGAAFSTGIGRATSLGLSLVMGAANVRLGVWWRSGLDGALPARQAWALLQRGVGALFRTQTYLSYEFTARFMGLNRRWQYLSDGGHFENTAIYELLRPERRVGFVFASDNGADPDYQFDDLANLIRLARIDLSTEVQVVDDFGEYAKLAAVFGPTEAFAPDKKQKPAALLLRSQQCGASPPPPCWIVLLKPGRQPELPADVLQYAATHPSFPQEPTADQFFDEAQWESYRCLGWHTARRVLQAEVWAELQAFIATDPLAQS